MSDINETDLDALLRMLNTEGWEHYHSAVTALVAERDALKARVMVLEKELAVDTMAVIAAMRKGVARES